MDILLVFIAGVLILALIIWLSEDSPLDKSPHEKFCDEFVKLKKELEKLDLKPKSKQTPRQQDKYIEEFFQPTPKSYAQPSKPAKPRNDSGNPMEYSNQFCSAEVKAKYLRSAKWKQLKNKRAIIAFHKCEVEDCTEAHGLHLHHVTYERLLNEHIDDVRLVCHKHHQEIHDKLGYDRTTYFPIK